MHDERWRKFGSVDLRPERSSLALFEAKVDRTGGPDACHVWTGAVSRYGYGRVRRKGVTVLAHRFAWELAFGPIPDGLLVCHHCDNPPCVNPRHLFLGTVKDNAEDCVGKGRSCTGERHPRHKLTPQLVSAIKRDHSAGGVTHRELAARYGVSQPSVFRAIHGDKRRRHPGPPH